MPSIMKLLFVVCCYLCWSDVFGSTSTNNDCHKISEI